MARTPSTMSPLGTTCPDFSLPDPRGGTVARDGAMGDRGLLVMFICNHCPFVVHVADALAQLGRDYADSDLGIVAISANDVETHPDDAPDKMADEAALRGYRFPYLYDETQSVARAFDAACTPDFFLYDAEGLLVYRGQLDDSRPGTETPVTGADLRAAMDALISGDAIPADQVPSLGCNIKWKSD